MVEITNETIGGNVSYKNGEYKITGDYRVNPKKKNVETMNVSVYKNEQYSGNVNVYTNGEERQVNYNNMNQDDVALISSEISSCISEIEERYSSVSLSI